MKELDAAKVRKDLDDLKNKTGIKSIAVLMAHSYTYIDHELQIGNIAKELGITLRMNVVLNIQINTIFPF